MSLAEVIQKILGACKPAVALTIYHSSPHDRIRLEKPTSGEKRFSDAIVGLNDTKGNLFRSFWTGRSAWHTCHVNVDTLSKAGSLDHGTVFETNTVVVYGFFSFLPLSFSIWMYSMPVILSSCGYPCSSWDI